MCDVNDFKYNKTEISRPVYEITEGNFLEEFLQLPDFYISLGGLIEQTSFNVRTKEKKKK